MARSARATKSHEASTHALAAVCVVAALGCSRTPTPAGVGPSSPVASTNAAASALSTGSSRAAATPAAPPDGCWSGFATDVPAITAPVERLKALAERCAQGSKPLDQAAETAELDAGQTKRHEFQVGSATGCIRVLAVGGAGVTDLGLDLLDATDASRARDQLRAPFALAPTPGSICLEPGKYRAVVSVTSGAGTVALSAYAAE